MDAQGNTPLTDAVMHRQRAVVDFLRMNHGQLSSAQNSTLICQAAARGDLEAIKLLIENGVDPNTAD